MPEPRLGNLVPYLFSDDAGELAGWLGRVFGFQERQRWHNDDGSVRNLDMIVGDTELWIDGGGRRTADGGSRPTMWIGVWVDDVDAMHRRVVACGVNADPPDDRAFGVRMMNVRDPEGNLWGFMRRQ